MTDALSVPRLSELSSRIHGNDGYRCERRNHADDDKHFDQGKARDRAGVLHRRKGE
jgi:hypothetical protein